MSHRSMIRLRNRELQRSARRQARRSKVGAGIAGAIGAAALMAPAAQGATIQVTNSNDSGPNSLRAAVATANLDAAPDTITFAAGLTSPITLTSGVIPIDAALTIEGPGAGALEINGDDNSQIFDINPSNVGAMRDPVSISGLTLAHGSAGEGGALYSYGSTLTLSDMTIRDNAASGNSGAIDIESSPLLIEDSRVTGNTAGSNGGAMYTDGINAENNDEDTVTIRDSVVSGNGSGGDGGAFYFDNATGGDVLIQGTTLSDNTSTGTGGAIEFYGHKGKATLRRSTLSGNTAGSNGGAIYFDSDYYQDGLLVEDSTISGNESSSSGGGVYVSNSNDEPVIFANSTVADNVSANEGGGIYRDNYDVTASSTIVADNESSTTDQNDLGEDSAASAGSFLLGFSLVESGADQVTVTPSPAGSNLLDTDPQLGPLGANGGPTATQTLPLSSPAIDAAIANGLTTDQRGLARTAEQPDVPNAPGSDGTDMGATELPAPPPPDTSVKGAKLSAKKKQKQRGKKIKVKVKAGAAEAVDLLASGKAKGGKRTLKLKPVRKSAAANRTVTLKLKPKKPSPGKIKKILRSGNGKAKIKVKFTDAAGNTATKRAKVKLKQRK